MMHALVVTLMLAVPGSDGLLDDGPDDPPPVRRAERQTPEEREAARSERERCLGAGAAGAIGAVVGLAIGAGIGFGLGAIVQAADTNNTSASKSFDAFAIPAGAAAGAVAGLAAGTIGAYDLTGSLAGKPSVMR